MGSYILSPDAVYFNILWLATIFIYGIYGLRIPRTVLFDPQVPMLRIGRDSTN